MDSDDHAAVGAACGALAGPVSPDLVRGEDGLWRPVWAATDPLLREYYDTEWGVPVRDERGVFERVSLEAFQSGLSWVTILRKRPAFREVFAGFDPDAVAAFGPEDVERLLGETRIVRNRAKIEATVHNARATLALRQADDVEGGLAGLVWSYRPRTELAPHTLAQVPTRCAESQALARELKRRGFRFVGPTTVFALMEAIGLVNTHLVGSWRRQAICDLRGEYPQPQ